MKRFLQWLTSFFSPSGIPERSDVVQELHEMIIREGDERDTFVSGLFAALRVVEIHEHNNTIAYNRIRTELDNLVSDLEFASDAGDPCQRGITNAVIKQIQERFAFLILVEKED